MKKTLPILLTLVALPTVALSQVSTSTRTVATSTPAVTEMRAVPAPDTKTYDDVAIAEEEYFAKNGKYLQILQGNILPDYETGTVAEKLGREIPPNAFVDVYDGPKGKGFRVVYTEQGIVYSDGHGPEARRFSSASVIHMREASTTPYMVEVLVGSSTEATSTLQ